MQAAATAPGTKSDQAYRCLRRAIVTFEVGADAPLDEAALMARYGLGRTPLREALKRLALEQFIRWPPHRTPYVRALGLDELAPLYETRLLLEVPVAGLAAERIADAELAGLDALLARIRQAADAGRPYEEVELDHELHVAIARGTHNRYLVEAVTALNCGSLRLWYRAQRQLGMTHVHELHERLVGALRRHDRPLAEQVAREHVLRSHQRQLALHALPVEPNHGD
ncbi:MAG TPA: GntR family transcriptional regulator [Thermomicrobiales bacterium]|nr:GntR family transcriptional regulator [Thermomicrobiales bacterium]